MKVEGDIEKQDIHDKMVAVIQPLDVVFYSKTARKNIKMPLTINCTRYKTRPTELTSAHVLAELKSLVPTMKPSMPVVFERSGGELQGSQAKMVQRFKESQNRLKKP